MHKPGPKSRLLSLGVNMSPLLSLSSVLLEPPKCVAPEAGSIFGLALSEKGREQGQYTAGLFGQMWGNRVPTHYPHRKSLPSCGSEHQLIRQ